jgi:hypothetical protein
MAPKRVYGVDYNWLDVLWWTVQGIAVAALVGLWIVGLFVYACEQPPGC